MKISSFAQNKFLSDIVLSSRKNKDIQEQNIPCHRLILATQSEILKDIIENNQQAEKIVLPQPIRPRNKDLDDIKLTTSTGNKQNQKKGIIDEDEEQQLRNVINLVYLSIEEPDQVREEISKIINKQNCFQYYSICLSLGFQKIKPYFEEYIISHIAKDDDSMNLLFDSIQYDSELMKTAALDIIVPKFSDFLRNQYLQNEIINLPFEAFKALIQRDDILVNEETDVFNILYKYILKRENDPEPPQLVEDEKSENAEAKSQIHQDEVLKPQDIPQQPQEPEPSQPIEKQEEDVEQKEEEQGAEGDQPSPQQEESDEKKNEENEEGEKKENVDVKEETIPKSNEVEEKPKENGKLQDEDNKDEKVYYMADNLEEQAKQKLQNYKLTQEQKKELLLSLRLGYISHENLLKYSNIEHLSDFKDIFLQAISSKLNYYDVQEFINKYQFNLDPRLSYAERVNNLSMINNSKINPNSTTQKRIPSVSQQFPSNDKNGNLILNESIKSENTQPVKGMKSIFNNSQKNQGLLQDSNRNDVPHNPYLLVDSAKYQNNNNDYNNYNNNNNNNNSNIHPFNGKSDLNLPSMNTFVQNMSQQQQQQMMLKQSQQQNQYIHQQQPLHQSLYQTSLQSGQIRLPQVNNSSNFNNNNVSQLRQANNKSLHNKQNDQNTIEFVYKYDMDDNGALYYLGTEGKRKPYVNPHILGQVQAFGSTVRAGKIEYFIGREVQNLSTCNERMSYMGVDLGEDRYLYPTAYTIRNRNSSTYVLFNWVLEASIDGIHYIPIDKRVHYDPNDQHFNHSNSQEREMLKLRGQPSSYAIDESNLRSLLSNHSIQAFRYFRIVQISKNSHGSDNLSLSGFELYGLSHGNGWQTY